MLSRRSPASCQSELRVLPRSARAEIRRTNLVKLASICCMFLMMATFSARATEDSIDRLAHEPGCVRAIEWIDRNTAWVTEQQIHLTEIPAPEFKEARRGEALKKLFEAS